MFERLQSALFAVSRCGAIIGGYALMGLSIAICVEIVLRRTAGVSLQGVDEIGGYVLAGTSAFGFAFALVHRAHTRIDLLYRNAPVAAQAVLNIAAAILVAAAAAFMTWRAVESASRSYVIGSIAASPLQTPIWIPQAIWASGLALFTCVAVVLVLRGFALLAQGPAALNAALGVPEIDARPVIAADDDDGRLS